MNFSCNHWSYGGLNGTVDIFQLAMLRVPTMGPWGTCTVKHLGITKIHMAQQLSTNTWFPFTIVISFALPPVICYSLLWNITIQLLEPYTAIIELNRPVSSVFQNYCNICVSVSNYHRVATGSS
jgi:amino acid permease